MSKIRELNNTKHNSAYYNKMLRAQEKKGGKNSPLKKSSFASKKVDFSQYLVVPSDYEGIAYTVYFILIPYIVGITFLFFYVARAAYTNFSLLDLSSFLIIWFIGYEITAGIILFFIFISFIKHLQNDK